MDSAKPGRQSSVDQWRQLIKKSLIKNVSIKAFEGEVLRMMPKVPLDGAGVVEAWAAAHDGGFTVRSRQIRYFEQMLQLKIYSHETVLDVLASMIKGTMLASDAYLIKAGVAKGEYKQCIEAVALERLAYSVLNLRTLKASKDDRIIDFRIYKPLMTLIGIYIDTVSSTGLLQGPALSIGLELGKFMGVYINDLSVSGILSSDEGGPPKAMKKDFGRLLTSFIPIITTGSADVGQSLALLQQQSGLTQDQELDQDDDGVADSIKTMAYQQSVVELPVVVTRAALYIFLNAMLAARPIADDTALFTFLNARYNGSVNHLIADLITASFDVLANAINRSEPTDSISVCRCFLINKVPALLQSFTGMLFPPMTMESCITGALRSMDPSSDPFSQQSFDLLSSSGMLSEARQEFLFACALYGLIPESSIETILGDVPMQSLPEAGKYNRSDLVTQCTTNPSRIEELVNELENFEGQAAEISAALTQIIRDCSAGRDSVTLKGICNALSRKMQALDVLLLFEQPSAILQPLCQLLDHWQDSEDHSESHPVYDEFGSIFLLVLVFKQRFDLQLSDLGVGYPDSFIRKYFSAGCVARSPAELSETHQKQLGGWVKGLFEAEGISDDLMSGCSPKDFHLLVATLFEQSLQATQAGLLAFDTMKGGFEYLLEPFLIPSLVTGLGWAARKLWETQPSTLYLDTLLPLLSQLIRPGSLSPEAKALHECVLATTAGPLHRGLSHVQRTHPRRSDVAPLLQVLRTRSAAPRSAAVPRAELEGWAAGNPGGLTHTLRHTTHTLVAWSARCAAAHSAGAAAPPSAPPAYSHRHPLAAVRMLGAPTVLGALLDEARKLVAGPAAAAAAIHHHHQQNETPSAAAGGGTAATAASAGAGGVAAQAGAAGPGFEPELVLDVLAAVVSAPDAGAARGGPGLCEAVQAALDDIVPLSRADPARAEMLVRLHRRVEVQMLRPPEPVVQGGVIIGAGVVGGAAGMGVGDEDMLMALGAEAAVQGGGGIGGGEAGKAPAGMAPAGMAPAGMAPAGMELDDLDMNAIGEGLVDSDFAW